MKAGSSRFVLRDAAAFFLKSWEGAVLVLDVHGKRGTRYARRIRPDVIRLLLIAGVSVDYGFREGLVVAQGPSSCAR